MPNMVTADCARDVVVPHDDDLEATRSVHAGHVHHLDIDRSPLPLTRGDTGPGADDGL